MNREFCFQIVDRIEEIHKHYSKKREALFYNGMTNNQIGNALLNLAEDEARELNSLVQDSARGQGKPGGTSSMLKNMQLATRVAREEVREESGSLLQFHEWDSRNRHLVGEEQDIMGDYYLGPGSLNYGFGYSEVSVQASGNSMTSLIRSKGCKNGACESQTGMRMASGYGYQ